MSGHLIACGNSRSGWWRSARRCKRISLVRFVFIGYIDLPTNGHDDWTKTSPRHRRCVIHVVPVQSLCLSGNKENFTLCPPRIGQLPLRIGSSPFNKRAWWSNEDLASPSKVCDPCYPSTESVPICKQRKFQSLSAQNRPTSARNRLVTVRKSVGKRVKRI